MKISLPYFLQRSLIALGMRPHQQRLLQQAEALYAKVVQQARSAIFFRAGGMLDHRDGRLEMLWLHLFLLYERLRIEPATRADDDIARLGEYLAEVAVSDLEQNLRHMGVGDLAVGRRMQKLAKRQYARLAMYRALFANDGTGFVDDHGHQRSANWMLLHYVYTDDEGNVSPQAAEAAKGLCRYIQATQASLAAQAIDGVMTAPAYISDSTALSAFFTAESTVSEITPKITPKAEVAP